MVLGMGFRLAMVGANVAGHSDADPQPIIE